MYQQQMQQGNLFGSKNSVSFYKSAQEIKLKDLELNREKHIEELKTFGYKKLNKNLEILQQQMQMAHINNKHISYLVLYEMECQIIEAIYSL